MRKCPICQKEFPDTMRFCQSDGTPLVDVIEESQPEDPLKTTVVRQEDIADAIPQSDPFKTMVASSDTREDSGDLLQLPQENFDPLKTMVAQPIGQDKPILEDLPPEPKKFEDIKQEIKAETPKESSFGGFSAPKDPLPETPSDYSNDPTLLQQPEPPKFNQPDLSPPSFNDYSAKKDDDDDLPQTVMQNPWDAGNPPKSDYSSDSPFAKPNNDPIPSPFDVPSINETKLTSEQESPSTSAYDTPQSPFGQPPQSSFDQPQTSYQEPPANQFGAQQFDQMNQGFGGNQPLQQNDWTPPPSPEQGWGDQGLGANTPFQPPPAVSGQNQTLPIVSLVFGIISVCCYISPITGIVALITGYLGMKNANSDPMQFGGKGLAIAGMITGGVFFVLGLLYWLYIIFVVGLAALGSLGGLR